MMKPIEELEALAPEQIDMNDPEIPETLKIRARNAMQKAKQNSAEADRQETCR